MADFITVLMEQWASLGFFSFLLPWLFTFAIVYGLLAKVNLFGGNNNRISALIGVIVAFFVAPYAGAWLAGFFATLSTGMVIVLGALLTVVIFAAMIGVEAKDSFGYKKFGVPIVAVIAIIVFFFALGGELGEMTIGSNTIMTVAFMVVLLLAIWFVVKGGEKSSGAGAGNQTGPTG